MPEFGQEQLFHRQPHAASDPGSDDDDAAGGEAGVARLIMAAEPICGS